MTAVRATVIRVGDLPASVVDELSLDPGCYALLQTDEDGAMALSSQLLQPVDVTVADAILVSAEPTFDRARLDMVEKEGWRVELVVPFPHGHPTCALCQKEEVTHVAVFEVEKDGQSGTAFGTVCDECAEPYVAEIESVPGAN